MLKSLLIGFIFILPTVKVNGQTPKELLLAIQKSNADTNRISLQLSLGSYYLFKPGEFKNDLDSAINFFNQALQLSLKLHEKDWECRTFELIGNYYSETGNLDLCRQYFMRAISYYHQNGNVRREADEWSWLGVLYQNNFKNDQGETSIIYYKNARNLYIKDHQTLMADTALGYIAKIHIQQGKDDLAENELLQIIKSKKEGEMKGLMNPYNTLAGLYIKKGEYNKALLYELKAEGNMQTVGDSLNAQEYYGRLSDIYLALGRYALSLEWAKKCLTNIVITKAQVGPVYISNRIVYGLIKEGKAKEALKFISNIVSTYKPRNLQENILLQKDLGDCYYELKNYAMYQKHYLEMARLFNNEKDSQYYAWIAYESSAIGQFYLRDKQYNNAKKYLTIALRGYEKDGTALYLQYVHSYLFKVDSSLGNYQSAIKHLRMYDKIKDSIFNIDRNKQIEELNIKYHTSERERDLKLVENRAELQLQRSQTTRNWIILGSGLLLIVVGLLYRQSRLRRKNNELITHKNSLLQNLVEEKEWLLKEVHHRVKNNLHTVICLLESQAAYLQNDALEAIEKSQHRIYTMSLIHQKLYQSDDVKTIDMAVYIPELVNYLSDSFFTSNQIYFNLAIEPINLNASQAIPLALLINEALTNSIKYAFPDNRRGEITIALMDTGEQYKLAIADNGVGMLQKEEKNVNSLGMDLMKGLAKEIGGRIDVENNDGVKITVVFGHDALNELEETDYLTSSSMGEA